MRRSGPTSGRGLDWPLYGDLTEARLTEDWPGACDHPGLKPQGQLGPAAELKSFCGNKWRC